jgi:hypothetical protein
MTHDVPDAKKGYLLLWQPGHPENERAQWYIEQLTRAWSRERGLTDDDKLRWLLDFARLNIEALSADEHTALGFDFLVRFVMYRDPSKDEPIPIPDHVFSAPELGEIQAQIADGLHCLMMDKEAALARFGGPDGIWVLPDISRNVRRTSALGYIETHFSVGYSPKSAVAMVVNAVADFVVRSGQRLRVCANCRTLFVANKRQAYCSPSCSQAKRTQRKRDRMRPVSTSEPQWYTRSTRA